MRVPEPGSRDLHGGSQDVQLVASIGMLILGLVILNGQISEAPAQAACYEFSCADNRPCVNDAGCLGYPRTCKCDVETNSCVPQGG